MPADTAILPLGTEATPALIEIPGALEFIMRAVYASYDGSAATDPFVPALQLLTASGEVAGTFALESTIAAGGSADVSWFPGGRVAASGTTVKTTNTGGTVTVDPTSELLIGTNLTLTNPSSGVAEIVAASGGGGISFGTDNVDSAASAGLQVEPQQYVPADFTQPNSQQSAGDVENFSQGFNAADGSYFTDDPGNFFNNGNPVVQIDHIISSGHYGGEGLIVRAWDTSAAPGDSECIGAQVSALSHSTVSKAEGLIVSATVETGGTADAVGLEASATNNGSGNAIALQTTSGWVILTALPTSSAGLPTGALWNNAGVVNIV